MIVVTTFDLDEYVRDALANGAAGFLLKDVSPSLLLEAVRAAHRGDVLVSPSITVRLLAHFTAEPRVAPPAPVVPLTAREEEVLQAAARGLSNSEIAEALFISLGTVKKHLAAIQDKLGARNRVEIAGFAWQTGRMDR